MVLGIKKSLENILRYKEGKPVQYSGINLDLSEGDISPFIKMRILVGTYENQEKVLIKRNLNSQTDVIELGGCLGATACVIDDLLDEETTHLVYEPNTELKPILERNKELNQANFEIKKEGYSSSGKDQTFYITEQAWGAGMYSEEKGVKEVTIPTKSISSIFQGSDIDEFNLVADIEGAEFELIHDEIEILQEKCNKIIIEFHKIGEAPLSIKEAKDILADAGFEKVDSRSNVMVYGNSKLQEN